MFIDNGKEFHRFADHHLRSALALIASTIESLEPEALLHISKQVAQGAQFATRVIGPGNGQGPVLELCLYHPEAGWQVVQAASVSVPAGSQTH